MRKTICYLLLAICAAACTSYEPIEDMAEAYGDSSDATCKRSISEVLEIASKATELIAPSGNENGLSRGVGRTLDYKASVIPMGRSKSRAAADTLLYIVNYADDNGFAMVSANKMAPELLAVTKKGHFDPNEQCEIYGLNLWLDETLQMLDYVESQSSNTLGTDLKVERDTINQRYVASRIPVAWGQSRDGMEACEGDECPNGIAGCANTAIAMAMLHVRRPLSMKLTYKEGQPTISLKWDELKKYLSKSDAKLNAFPVSDFPIRETIAQLFREIGEQTHSTYRIGSTGASSNNIFKTLHQFAITSSSGWEDGAGLECYNTLFYNGGGILMVKGTTSAAEGHAWICDGLHNYNVITRVYESTGDGSILVKTDEKNEEFCLVSYNWGWHGYCDGYYLHTETVARNKDGKIEYDFTQNRQVIKILGV